jgi:hypothetical protein
VRDLAAKAIVPSIKIVAERYDGERTTVRAATTPIDLQFASRGKEVEFMPSIGPGC